MTGAEPAIESQTEPCGATDGEVAQLSPGVTGERVGALFTVEAGSIREARRFVTEQMVGLNSEMIRDTVLMVSELATNCIKHARSAFSVNLITDEPAICVEVADNGPGLPRRQRVDRERSSGRGLQIVEQLADTWGVAAEKTEGKTVWFTIAPHPER